MLQKFFSRFKFRLILVGALVLLWWWVKYIQEQEEKDIQTNAIKLSEPTRSSDGFSKVIEKIETDPATPVQHQIQQKAKAKNDLRKIEGIGPKIASVLSAAGIESFDKLAGMKPEEIKVILEEAKIPLAQPDTWPEQARLAAENNWQALESFQSQLKGGRRV